jgi:hypothetical protein
MCPNQTSFNICYRFGVFLLFVGVGWVHLVRQPLFGLLYQPRMIDDDECGAVGGMRISMGNWSTRRKPAPSATLFTTNSNLTLDQTQATAVGSQPGVRNAYKNLEKILLALPYMSVYFSTLNNSVPIGRIFGTVSFGKFWKKIVDIVNFVSKRTNIKEILYFTHPSVFLQYLALSPIPLRRVHWGCYDN